MPSVTLQGGTVLNGNLVTLTPWMPNPSAARQVTDGVLNSTTTITSATANFTGADVGSAVTGTGIPANTVIATFVNATTVTLNHAATATTTGVTLNFDDAYVTLNTGKTRTVEEYLGIPYATAPIGDRRFMLQDLLPEPATSPFDATVFKSVPVNQPLPNQDQVVGRASTGYKNPFNFKVTFGVDFSEDCLNLNVWTPTHAPAAPLPVMVWIHGGGFVRNTTTQPAGRGTFFAARGVVLVTLEYRLTGFGHFWHESFGNDRPRGSVAIHDQVLALRWIKRNIAAFGGDINNITICGESAGGASVTELMLTSLIDWNTETLFHRVGCISGGGAGEYQRLLEADGGDASTQVMTRNIFEAMWQGSPAENPTDDPRFRGLTVAQVRQQYGDKIALQHAVSADQIMGAYGFRDKYNFFADDIDGHKSEVRAFPIFDGDIIIEDQRIDAFDAGRQRDLPLMIGGMGKEATVFGLGNATSRNILNTTDILGVTTVKDLADLKAVYDTFNSRVVTDGHLNSNQILTSATGNFTAKDVGARIYAEGIQSNTVIQSVESTTSITLSLPAFITSVGARVTIGWDSDLNFGDDVVGDVVFLYPARQMARGHKAHKTSPVYYFNFRYTSSGNNSTDTLLTQGRAGHGTDLYLLFHQLDWGVSLGAGNLPKIRSQDIYLSDAFQQMWVNYAAYGNPNTHYTYANAFNLYPYPIPFTWDAFVAANDNALIYDNVSFVATIAMQSGFRQSIMEFYRSKAGLP